MHTLEIPEGVYNEDMRIRRAVLNQWAKNEDNHRHALHTPDLCDGYWNILDSDSGRMVCRFGLSPMRGCFAAVIGHSLEVEKEHRGHGYGSFVVEFCLNAMRAANYSLYIVTVRSDNEAMLRIFEKFKFSNCFGFINHKNDSNIICLAKGLKDATS